MSARDFFRRNVIHNLGLKVLALLLAAGLWLAIASSPPSEIALNVAVIFRNMPSNLEISSENIPTVQVRVRGPEAVVSRLRASDIRAEIDLADVKPGEHTFDLTHQIGVPDRLTVSEVVPSEIHLAFDSRATRTVPVEARVSGDFVPGYRIASRQVVPASVEITGPQKQVSSIAAATTDPIDVTGVVGRISVARHAYISDPLIQVVNPRSVRVTITMEPDTSATQPK